MRHALRGTSEIIGGIHNGVVVTLLLAGVATPLGGGLGATALITWSVQTAIKSRQVGVDKETLAYDSAKGLLFKVAKNEVVGAGFHAMHAAGAACVSNLSHANPCPIWTELLGC